MTKLSNTQLAYLMEATKKYAEALKGTEEEQYLAKRLPPGYVQTYALGLVSEPMPGHEDYRGRIAIPFLRRSSKGVYTVHTIRYRCPAYDCQHKDNDVCHGKKYLNTSGDDPMLYNTVVVQNNHDEVAITEGEFDALVSTYAGLPAVGVPGVKTWDAKFASLFQGYETVYILGDNDDKNGEGRAFAKRVRKDIGANAAVRMMPRGYDVSSFVLEHGSKALMERIKK